MSSAKVSILVMSVSTCKKVVKGITVSKPGRTGDNRAGERRMKGQSEENIFG